MAAGMTDTPWSTLAAAITRLNDRIDAMPSVREATVASDDPVAVMFDTDTAQTLVQGSLVGGLAVGARVLTLRLRHYVWVLGAKAGSAGGASGGITGEIRAYAGSSAPAGWALCNGQTASRTGEAALFAVIGTTYGVGDGSTTYNLPNLKGRALVGLDTGQTEFNTLGKTGGAKTHTLTQAEIPAHTHYAGGGWGAGTSNGAKFRIDDNSPANDWNTGSAGGGAAHNNLQPYLTVNFIIKT